ncbi:cytochrome P450 [Coprinopsis marcescibilis]|uniref:Cytochrome P450 n=1 Tax=Coprinopsis marcescibilis TaxID=230819 RepID=A0A5C3KJJ5_COPMA|nr:cytochrome P450 [Coprinopsis marcescibilis]
MEDSRLPVGDAAGQLAGILPLLPVLFLSYILLLIPYRLWLHPLAHFPGPPAAAISNLYLGYYDFWKSGGLNDHLVTLHEKYGKVVRIGPNRIHFSTVRAYDAIYRNPKFLKDAWWYDAFHQSESTFGYIDPAQAKERREIMRPLFSRKSVQKLEQCIQDCVDRLLVALAKVPADQEVDLFYAYLSVSLEVITTYCFAKSYHAIEHPKFKLPFLVALQEGASISFLFRHVPFIAPFVLGMPAWLAKLVSPGAAAIQAFFGSLEDQLKEVLKDPSTLDRTEHEIICHHLLNPKSQKPLSWNSLREEASLMIAAGSDTVGATATIGTYHVLRNAKVKKRLREELVAAWPDPDSPMPWEKLEKIPYLTAVVKESLRMAHGTVSPLPRVVPEDQVIASVTVPAGTVVAMNSTFVHLNEGVFFNARSFNPDRWLEHTSNDLDSYLVAFSKGPRSCLGINLAWAELYLILGNVFRKANLEISPKTT